MRDEPDDDELQPSNDRGPIVMLRGFPVIFAATVARAFDVETREVTQAIRRNPLKFKALHAFELTMEELDSLTSQGVISKPGRGGSRARPWALTQKGVVRLTTIINSPRALDAVDMIIDIFIEVYQQLAQGRQEITITNPSRLTPDPTVAQQMRAFCERLVAAMNSLLDTVIDPKSNATVRDELSEASGGALAHLFERLRTRGLENEKVEAETALILANVRKIRDETAAAAQKSHAETEKIVLENLNAKISLIERLMKMSRDLEPNAVVQLLGDFDQARLARLAPRAKSPPPDSEG